MQKYKKGLLSFLILFVFVIGTAQVSQYARRIYPVYITPSTPCSEGSVYYHMLEHKFLICKNTGIAEVGAGGGTIPNANATTTGLLTSTDWVIFNNKQVALGFTPENIANKGASNGYADLVGGKIPIARISEVLASTDLSDYSTSSGTGTTAIKSTISGAATNDVLTWNGSNWVNLAVSNFGTVPSDDQVLIGNGTIFELKTLPACSNGINDKLLYNATTNTFTCGSDQVGVGGSGITSLNTLTGTTQTFSRTNDTNVTLTLTPSGTDHNFALGWTGTLAKTRMVSTTVHTDQNNTFGAFTQTFQAGSLFKLVDSVDNTKAAQFDLANIGTGVTRTINIPNANSTTVQSSSAGANQFANSISAQGVVGYAQPDFSNLSGSATDAQIPNTLTLTTVSNLTSNGFVKTSGGVGTLSVDTNTYLTGNQTITLSGNVTGSGATAITTTIANNVVTGAMIALGSDAQGDIMFYNGSDWVRLGAGTSGQFLQTQGVGANPIWATATGSGDMLLAGVQTVTGAKTFNAAKLIVGTSASAPTIVANSFYRDTTDGKLYIGDNAGASWNELFEAGVSLLNLASNVTGILPIANGGLGVNLADPNADRILFWDDSAGAYAYLTAGSGLSITGTTITATGGGSGDVVGPASATDNAIVRFDTTTGKLVQNSGVTIDDSNNISTAGNISLGVGGSVAGFIELTQGTAPSLGTTSVTLYAPTSVTSYAIVYPTAAGTGIPHFSNSSNVITMSISAIDLASADVTGDLPFANITQASAASKLLGRGDSGAGDFQEITLGSGLTMTGTTLSSTGGGGAPTDATYITQTANGTLSAEQVLGSLATGILKNTTTTGVLSIAAAGTDYTSPSSTESFTNKTITSSTNILGGVTMTLGSDATGDIYYRNSGGVLTRLGVGTNGQVLTLASGLPSWANSSGGSSIQYINLLDSTTMPDSSGNVFQEPYTIKATNDFWKYSVWIFNNPTADELLHGKFELPVGCASGASFKLVWTSTATTGTFQYSIRYRVITADDTNSLDQATAIETVTGSDTAPTATDRRMEVTITPTNSNFATAGTVQWILTRVDTSDTLAAAISVHSLRFQCTP